MKPFERRRLRDHAAIEPPGWVDTEWRYLDWMVSSADRWSGTAGEPETGGVPGRPGCRHGVRDENNCHYE